MGHPTYLSTIFYNLFMYLPTYLPTTYQPTYLHTFVFTYLLQPTYPPTHLPIVSQPKPWVRDQGKGLQKGETRGRPRRHSLYVVTLTLGSQPRQEFVRGQNKRETWEAHLILPRVQENVREWTLTLPRQLPLGEFKSRRTPKSSRGDCKGQNPSVFKKNYIIRKLLKHRCLKWARITHLDIWNTSYGQKKGRESNWQFNS